MELISHHYNVPLASHFGVKKTCELLIQKYYWPTFRHNVKIYMKSCNVRLVSKVVCHKSYSEF